MPLFVSIMATVSYPHDVLTYQHTSDLPDLDTDDHYVPC